MNGFKIALLISALLMALCLWGEEHIPLIQGLELKTLETRFQLRGPLAPSKAIVIVAIDDYSIEQLGRWPWPRSYHAEAVKALFEDGARVIGFDLILSEPDDSFERVKLRELRQYFQSLSISTQTKEGQDFGRQLHEVVEACNNDQQFAEAMGKSKKVGLGLYFHLPDKDKPKSPSESREEEVLGPPTSDDFLPSEIKRTSLKTISPSINQKKFLPPVAEGISLPLSEFYQKARCIGHINSCPDMDGSLRWETMIIEFCGQYYPVIGLQLLKEYCGLSHDQIKVIDGEAILFGKTKIPLDEKGRLLINYYGPDCTFPYYSLADVVQGLLPAGTFKDKIVLIGGAGTGLGDVWPSPFSELLPGVEKHATVISNILQKDFLKRNDRLALLDLLFILAIGLILGLLLPKLSPIQGTLFALLTLAVVSLANYALFSFWGLWIQLVYPLLSVFLVSMSIITFHFFTEEKEKRQIKGAFKHYLNPVLVEEVARNPEKLALGGEKRELTVMFSDIRNFTKISESLSPEQLVNVINTYLSTMTRIILEQNGLVDKFIGDAIMAVFGAPLPFPEHPAAACITALRMIEELQRVKPLWRERGFPDFSIGLGINTGPMVIGNLGSEERFDYTVLGDSVNLASRLEGLNKLYGTQIIISEFTASRLEGIRLRELDLVKVKGKDQAIRIFEVLGQEGEATAKARTEEYHLYEEAYHLYSQRQWAKAGQAFQALAEQRQTPLYTLYKERCNQFLAAEPPKDWDGAYVLTSK